jgi:hypothetical protein
VKIAAQSVSATEGGKNGLRRNRVEFSGHDFGLRRIPKRRVNHVLGLRGNPNPTSWPFWRQLAPIVQRG